MPRLLWTLTIGVALLAPLIAVTRVFADPAPPSSASAVTELPPVSDVPARAASGQGPASARPWDDRAGAVGLTARLPDLTIRDWYSERGEPWVWVINQGSGDAGPFRVAVFAGAQSFAIQLEGLRAGSEFRHRLPDFECGQPALYIVDVWSQVSESDEGNNTFPSTDRCQVKRRLSN
jgi:hypothetical protein